MPREADHEGEIGQAKRLLPLHSYLRKLSNEGKLTHLMDFEVGNAGEVLVTAHYRGL